MRDVLDGFVLVGGVILFDKTHNKKISMEGFESVIYDSSISEDGEVLEYLVDEANGANSHAYGMTLIQKLERAWDSSPSFRQLRRSVFAERVPLKL